MAKKTEFSKGISSQNDPNSSIEDYNQDPWDEKVYLPIFFHHKIKQM